MSIASLREFPDGFDRAEVEKYLTVFDDNRVPFGTWLDSAPSGWHESLFRSFQVLQKVKHLLAINTPAEVVLEIIKEAGE